MNRRWISPAKLGNAYDLADQSVASITAGLTFFAFIVFMAIADLTDADSILSAITRLGGVVSAIATVITINWVFPKSLSRHKQLMALFGTIGVIMQFIGVRQLMHATAEVDHFFNFLLAAQFFYSLVLLIYGLCILKHPLLPSWVAVGLLFAGVVWSINYWYIAQSETNEIVSFLAWGPALVVEVAACGAFVHTGLKQQKLSRLAIQRGKPDTQF